MPPICAASLQFAGVGLPSCVLRAWSILSLVLISVASATTPTRTESGFAVPQAGQRLEFPAAHGSHPDYAIEWWYLTGHLTDVEGREYGVQATFFRQANPELPPAARSGEPDPAFGHEHLLLGHMALVDIAEGRFYHQEQLARPGWDAWAREGTLDVRLGAWTLAFTHPPGGHAETMALRGGTGSDTRLALQLVPAKEKVIFGENGVSRKGAAPTAVSTYITFSRLTATGELWLGEERREVTGSLWMDHEISSSQLSPEQVGWDWASIQFEDQRELMVYVLRHEDGRPDAFSTATWVAADGRQSAHRPGAFTWTPERWWTSPVTGGRYPIASRLTVPDPATGQPRTFTLEPLLDAQELPGDLGGIAYWEGACRVLDEQGQEVGRAYVELTGYAASLQGRL